MLYMTIVRAPLATPWLLDPAVVFLNHGSFGACPRAVLETQSRLRTQMETEPVRFLTRKLEPLLDASRDELARLLHTCADNLVFVHNATTGVNAVVHSLVFRPGDELLTTSHDYNACRNVLHAVAQRTGARVVVAPVPFPVGCEQEIIDAVLAAATDRTRLALIDHATSPTALLFPVARIVHALADRGIDTLVDGAHAPGMVPLDLDALGAAYYTGNCHKWLCAPKGAGFLFVRPDRHDRVQPATVSHGFNTPRPGRNRLHTAFDWVGTIDPTPWLCVGAAIRWCDALWPGGLKELMRRNHALAIEARQVVCHALGVAPPCPDSLLGSMATIPLANAADALQERLFADYAIEVPIVRWGHPEQRGVRLSSQAYNHPAQYARLAAALTALVRP